MFKKNVVLVFETAVGQSFLVYKHYERIDLMLLSVIRKTKRTTWILLLATTQLCLEIYKIVEKPIKNLGMLVKGLVQSVVTSKRLS